jgi:hypothetical protein
MQVYGAAVTRFDSLSSTFRSFRNLGVTPQSSDDREFAPALQVSMGTCMWYRDTT